MDHTFWHWAAFAAFIFLMLAIDLGVVNRRSHALTYKEAAVWSAVWVSLAAGFATLIFVGYGRNRGVEFVTGYLIELSLSVDNLFVFILIFAYFKVPPKYQHRVLFWGVLGALFMRISMILVGAELVEKFHWINYVFGAFLVYTGIKMLRETDGEIEPENTAAVRLVTRYVPLSRRYEGESFFTRIDGRRVGTLLLLVLIIVEITDLLFAVDSIPAIFAVTNDRFILYSSNVFAILGLRSLFFLIAGFMEKFHFLRIGLAAVLAFIGVKMVIGELGIHISIELALGAIALLLGAAVAASLIWPLRGAQQGPAKPALGGGSIPVDLSEEKTGRSDENSKRLV